MGVERVLLPEHVVGRSSKADLRLDYASVSHQHAVVRWTGIRWEVRDLGSLNGTFLNGDRRLVPGEPRPLARADVLRFGGKSQEWTLLDDGAPGTMAVPIDGGEPVVTHGTVLAVPTPDQPDVTLFVDSDGIWKLQRAEEPIKSLANGQTFEAGGRLWRFTQSDVVVRTTGQNDAREVRNLLFRFSVSRDEEHVELKVEREGRIFDLGSRAHHYLLLTLARERLKDIGTGTAQESCGWVYQDDLIDALAIPPTQLNVDIHRIRKQLESLDLVDAANIVERRPRSKQVRIGVTNITVATI